MPPPCCAPGEPPDEALDISPPDERPPGAPEDIPCSPPPLVPPPAPMPPPAPPSRMPCADTRLTLANSAAVLSRTFLLIALPSIVTSSNFSHRVSHSFDQTSNAAPF